MLLVYFLVISLVSLLAYAMSKEKGKNTKFARKGANAIPQKPELIQTIDTSEVIEVN